mgnify:CR=1 FL=1
MNTAPDGNPLYGRITIKSKLNQARRFNFVYNGAGPGYKLTSHFNSASQFRKKGGDVGAK